MYALARIEESGYPPARVDNPIPHLRTRVFAIARRGAAQLFQVAALTISLLSSAIANGQDDTPAGDESASVPNQNVVQGDAKDLSAPEGSGQSLAPPTDQVPTSIPADNSVKSPSSQQANTMPASSASAVNVHPVPPPETVERDPRSPESRLATKPLQDKEAWDWTALPVGTYSPATQLGLGAFGALLFRLGEPFPKSRPSSVAVVGLLTTRRQAVFEFIPELYWDHDRTRLWSKLDYRYYPNAFWGVGPRTQDSQKEWYVENGPRLQMQFRHIFYEHLYLEGRLDAQFLRVQGIAPGGLLDSGTVVGDDGKRVIGIGPTLGWDSRDHSLEPHTGGFYELSVLQFHKALLSQFTFTRLEVNLRRYLRLAEGHVLAMQTYGEFAFGQVPFYRMPQVGGQRMLRSYFEGRFRDKAYLAAQIEYRVFLFWRLGAVVFASAGDVGPSINKIPFKPLKWSIGGGLRFRLNQDERLNLRADLGFGYDSVGFYVGIAEAF